MYTNWRRYFFVQHCNSISHRNSFQTSGSPSTSKLMDRKVSTAPASNSSGRNRHSRQAKSYQPKYSERILSNSSPHQLPYGVSHGVLSIISRFEQLNAGSLLVEASFYRLSYTPRNPLQSRVDVSLENSRGLLEKKSASTSHIPTQQDRQLRCLQSTICHSWISLLRMKAMFDGFIPSFLVSFVQKLLRDDDHQLCQMSSISSSMSMFYSRSLHNTRGPIREICRSWNPYHITKNLRLYNCTFSIPYFLSCSSL